MQPMRNIPSIMAATYRTKLRALLWLTSSWFGVACLSYHCFYSISQVGTDSTPAAPASSVVLETPSQNENATFALQDARFARVAEPSLTTKRTAEVAAADHGTDGAAKWKDAATTVPPSEPNSTTSSAATHKTATRITTKCSLWNSSLDDWWQDHPDWVVSRGDTNDTHTCLEPIPDPRRAQFLRRVHQLQFADHGQNCSEVNRVRWFNKGFSVTVHLLVGEFYHSVVTQQRPFQVVPNANNIWIYAPPPAVAQHWASCKTRDMFCYFLPISSNRCNNNNNNNRTNNRPAKAVMQQLKRIQEYDNSSKESDKHTIQQQQQRDELRWLYAYTMRPRQATRYHLYQLLHSRQQQPQARFLQYYDKNCTVLHVRRGDATTESKHPRNFYPLQQYLERGHVTTNDTIVLLTDDNTTLQEANILYPNYQWKYLARPRHQGGAPFNAHIPSGDPAMEVLYILAELQLASTCQKLVHGTSNMVQLIQYAMTEDQSNNADKDITTVAIDADFSREQWVPGTLFLAQLEKQLESAQGITKPMLLEEEQALLLQRHCVPWNADSDEWWQSHADWMISATDTNQTHTCFQPHTSKAQRDFYRQLVHHQWHRQCFHVAYYHQRQPKQQQHWTSVLGETLVAFYSARQEGYTFVPYYDVDGTALSRTGSNRTCSPDGTTASLECYFLPISHCPATASPNTVDSYVRKRKFAAPVHDYYETAVWMASYLMRPRHTVRRQLWQLQRRHTELLASTSSCLAAVDVRQIRNTQTRQAVFSSLNEWYEKHDKNETATMVLLADDRQSLVQAQQLLRSTVEWRFLDRTRYIQNQHSYNISKSTSASLPVLLDLIEFQWVQNCGRLFHGPDQKNDWLVRMTANVLKSHRGWAVSVSALGT